VDVAVVAIDHDDLHVVAIHPAQAVRRQRPSGPGTQDDDAIAQSRGSPMRRDASSEARGERAAG
jgi:hypothetical protein